MRRLRGGFVLVLLLLPIIAFSETVFVTKTGHKYHTESCKYLRTSKIQIEISEAQRLGFGPCSVCIDNALNTGWLETNAEMFFGGHSSKTLVVFSAVSVIIVFIVLFIKRRNNKHRISKLDSEGRLSELEQRFLIAMLYEKQVFETYSLNDFLGLKGKSMDAQRKYRARFIKSLNDKLYRLHNTKEPILRVPSSDDKRIICYSINQDHIDILRKVYQPQLSEI